MNCWQNLQLQFGSIATRFCLRSSRAFNDRTTVTFICFFFYQKAHRLAYRFENTRKQDHDRAGYIVRSQTKLSRRWSPLAQARTFLIIRSTALSVVGVVAPRAATQSRRVWGLQTRASGHSSLRESASERRKKNTHARTHMQTPLLKIDVAPDGGALTRWRRRWRRLTRTMHSKRCTAHTHSNRKMLPSGHTSGDDTSFA